LKASKRNACRFPEDWEDPLELYGGILEELRPGQNDLSAERVYLKELIDRYGAEWAWDNRRRLLAMSVYFRTGRPEASCDP
jgi:hypothetical protein